MVLPDDKEPHESDGEESSLSLSDLPIMTRPYHKSDDRDSSPPSQDFFEFFSASAASDMCAADDVILRGKLLPFRSPLPPPPKRSETHSPNFPPDAHRRSDSSDGTRGRWSGKLTAEYRRVSDSDVRGGPPPQKSRPRWYVLLFGSVKVPAAMEMSEIRIRQRRRSEPTMGRRTAEDSAEGGPWKVLRSLSCKGLETAIVA